MPQDAPDGASIFFSGHPVRIDVTPENGGSNAGPRPPELLLHALGGFSGTDVAAFIRKMQFTPTGLEIKIDRVRAPEHTKRFIQFHLTYRLKGPGLDPERARHAVDLSLTKYCSMAASLNAEITYDVVVEEDTRKG